MLPYFTVVELCYKVPESPYFVSQDSPEDYGSTIMCCTLERKLLGRTSPIAESQISNIGTRGKISHDLSMSNMKTGAFLLQATPCDSCENIYLSGLRNSG